MKRAMATRRRGNGGNGKAVRQWQRHGGYGGAVTPALETATLVAVMRR
jgi:hypothetical protein